MPIVLAATLLVTSALAAWGWLRPQRVVPVVRYLLTVDSIAQIHNWMGEVAVSPDGATIAYGGGLSGPIRMRRRDQLRFTQIASTEGGSAPFFSPDGKKFGFWQNGKLMLMPIAGGPTIVLADSLDVPEACSWGEDGYIYRAGFTRGKYLVYRMRPASGAQIRQRGSRP